jgi:choline-sulfatase
VKFSLTIILLLTSSAASAAASELAKPDIFLITIDTLRADHVHCYGDSKISTPALDGLAGQGIRFNEAFTPSPITNTSHASILTGLLPGSHGVTDFGVPLAETHPNIAELLKAQGYHTAAFIGAVILDSRSLAPGFDRGFDFYDNFPEPAITKFRWGRLERRGLDVVHDAERWLTEHREGPHFVWVHLYDPHDPYEPPLPYSETYKDRLYDGEIAYADSALGEFFSYLKKAGQYSNAVIVAVGDHGEGLGQHNEDTHGIFLYDSTTHVPLIIKLPGASNAGTTVEAQVQTIDIMPTLLDLAGAPAPPRQDGESLQPFFAGQTNNPRPAFGETDYPLRFGWAPLRSFRSDGFKFIEAPRPELYDLTKDAAESVNQYGTEDPRAIKARSALANLHSKESGTTGLSALNPRSLPDPKDKIQEQNLLHTAMIAADDNRVADARKALEEVLVLDPASPNGLSQIGELELDAGEFTASAIHLKAAMKARPNNAGTAFRAGEALEKAQDFRGARDALESSLKLSPEQLPARLLLGRVYLELKDAPAAADQFEAASLINPDNTEAQIGLAKVQMVEQHFAEAADQLDPLAKSHPDNAEIFELLSDVYRSLGRPKEAERAAAAARELHEKR